MKGTKMEIRKSAIEDIDSIMNIFAAAKQFMDEHGNQTQWEKGYPSEELLRTDIQNGNNYVITENGSFAGTFSFIIGADPTYAVIKNGGWHYDLPYGTIHRLASNGTAKGISRACFNYCLERADYLRIDTYKNNIAMRAAIEKFGFEECGIILVRNGTERIAYDYMKK